LDQALRARVINNRSIQALWIYKAHYLHETGKFEAALVALDTAFQAYDSNPAPLFLATEWLVEAKDKVRAEKYFARAQAMAKKSRQDFSENIDRIRTNLRDL
jgi:thioredoxin-like negative regulator of GroEL